LSALAVATAGVDAARAACRVCPEDESREKNGGGEEREPEKRAAKERLERDGRVHGGSVLGMKKKTDGAVALGDSGRRF